MKRSRSGYAVFLPRARLLRLIGAELISDEVLAVTELVKNAHDADASTVRVEFHRATTSEGEIVIRDDGEGMDLPTVLGVWMEPGATSKIGGNGHMTRRGRRVLGEKGVGRFAVDKLAARLQLISHRTGTSEEIRATFDWDDFNAASMLSDVKAHWTTQSPTEIAEHGTVLRMSGLRSPWTERMYRRLATRLSRLRSPFRELDDLTIVLESDEFPQYSGELRADFLDRAPYQIEARFDGQQLVDIQVGGDRRTRHPWTGASLHCGPVRIKLFAFDLETEAVASVGPRMEVRAWLKEWSGVSVYRDGFRVWPYGEPHDDWLRLDQRRVNNPVVRLSNNQIVGFVEISRDANPELRDQTNREGLLNNEAFHDLRRIVYFALEVLENERQSRRHPRSAAASPALDGTASSGGASSLTLEVEKLARQMPDQMARELRRLARHILTTTEREDQARRRHLQAYAELAAAGQVSGLLWHSVQALVREVMKDCEDLGAALNGQRTPHVSSLLKSLQNTAEDVDSRLTEAMSESDGPRGRRAIDIATELRRCRRLLDPLLSALGIEMQVTIGKTRLVRTEMRPETFRHLMWLLTENAIEWTTGVKHPRVSFSVRARGDRCEILVSDNGHGIPPSLVTRIFEPFFSRKEGGKGLGLTIANSIVTAHRGGMDVACDVRRRGATFRIWLPRKRSRATVHGARPR
jgi:signal transduction histidine kinase